MARRRRASVGEGGVEAFARLPWWACLALAVAAWCFFGWWAARPLAPVDPARVSALVVGAATRGWAAAAQVAAPILLVVAAIVSAATQRRRRPSDPSTAVSTLATSAFAPSVKPRMTRPAEAPTVRRRDAPDDAPMCPRCGRGMALRTARRGASAGAGFWGCTGFPRCHGTRPA